MIKESERIRIWKANLPLKSMAGTAKVVGIYADMDFLDSISIKFPASYLQVLQTLQNALMNQFAYTVLSDAEKPMVDVACNPIGSNGQLLVYRIRMELVDGDFYIREFNAMDLGGFGWKNMKKQRRTTKSK